MKLHTFLLCSVLAGMIAEPSHAGGCGKDIPVTLAASGGVIQSGAITKLDLSWFGIEGSAAGPSFYVLNIHNSDDKEHSVRLMIEQKATPASPGAREACKEPCWLQREITIPFKVPAKSTVVKTSRDLFRTEFENGGIEAASSPFKSLIGRLGYIPSSYLELRFRLLCENMDSKQTRARTLDDAQLEPYTIASASISADKPLGPDSKETPFYQATETPDLLSPGAPPSEGSPEVLTQTPTFIFQSELASPIVVYPEGESKFTLELWSLPGGTKPTEVIERTPTAKHSTSSSIVPFPSDWPVLEEGRSYVWRVKANLRGPVRDYRVSELHQFTVSSGIRSGGAPSLFQSQSDLLFAAEQAELDRRIDALQASLGKSRTLSPEERRLFRALFLILGDDPRLAQLMASEAPDLDHLRVDGNPISLETLESIAAQVRSGRRKIVGVTIP